MRGDLICKTCGRSVRVTAEGECLDCWLGGSGEPADDDDGGEP